MKDLYCKHSNHIAMYLSSPCHLVPLWSHQKFIFKIFNFSTKLKLVKLNWGKPQSLCFLWQTNQNMWQCLSSNSIISRCTRPHKATLKIYSKEWRAGSHNWNNKLIQKYKKHKWISQQIYNPSLFSSTSKDFVKVLC